MYTPHKVFCKEKKNVIENIINALWQSWFITIRRLDSCFPFWLHHSQVKSYLSGPLRDLGSVLEDRKARGFLGQSRPSLQSSLPMMAELFQTWVKPSDGALCRTVPLAPKTLSALQELFRAWENRQPLFSERRQRKWVQPSGLEVSLKVRGDGMLDCPPPASAPLAFSKDAGLTPPILSGAVSKAIKKHIPPTYLFKQAWIPSWKYTLQNGIYIFGKKCPDSVSHI